LKKRLKALEIVKREASLISIRSSAVPSEEGGPRRVDGGSAPRRPAVEPPLPSAPFGRGARRRRPGYAREDSDKVGREGEPLPSVKIRIPRAFPVRGRKGALPFPGRYGDPRRSAPGVALSSTSSERVPEVSTVVGLPVASRRRSTKWFRSTRLVTRTKESNTYASARDEETPARNESDGRESPGDGGRTADRSFSSREERIRVGAFVMGPERW